MNPDATYAEWLIANGEPDNLESFGKYYRETDAFDEAVKERVGDEISSACDSSFEEGEREGRSEALRELENYIDRHKKTLVYAPGVRSYIDETLEPIVDKISMAY